MKLKNTKNNKRIRIKKFALLLVAVFLIYLFLAIPKEKKGGNIEERTAYFNVYIVNNGIDEKEFLNYLEEANRIWGEYNISIIADKIEKVYLNISKKEINLLYSEISHRNSPEKIEKICKEKYISLINKITKNNTDYSIIYLQGNNGSGGRGHLCGHKFVIIFGKEKLFLRDMTGWNLAHEIGHVFGLEDRRKDFQINLMNDKYKIFGSYSFLTQEQINTVKKNIRKKD